MSERRIERAERLLAEYTHALDDLLKDALDDLPVPEYGVFIDCAVTAIADAWATHVSRAGSQ